MVDRDVVTARAATIDRCLDGIALTRGERRAVLLPDYQTLDSRIVEAIVTRHLDDLRAFAAGVIRHFGL
jgi:uncharacterized protein YutE (UPF0331/DUF86 family)